MATNSKKTSPHDAVLKLMLRKGGANITEIHAAGFVRPGVAAIQLAKRNGYKATKRKAAGALTSYIAAKAATRSKAEA
jgi:hypothetical protein